MGEASRPPKIATARGPFMFGKYAAERRHRLGKGRPETFDFLGFTHYCATSRDGKFIVKRKTQRKRKIRR